MNELEKAYQEIERWHCCAEQEGFVNENEISYLDYVKNHINNLQSKIDKTVELLEDFKSNSKDVENEWAVEICELSIRKLKEDK